MIHRRRTIAAAALAVLALGSLAGCRSEEQRRAEHVERAESYLAEGRSSEALLELRSALKLDPRSAELNFRIGELLESQGRLGDALFFYQEAARLAPEDARGVLAAARLEMFEDPERAGTMIEAVVAREPDNPLAHLRRSELALVRARTDDALAAALTAVELAPRSHLAHFQVGVVHRARIRERQLLRQPEDPRLHADALAAFDRGIAVATPDAPVHEVVRGWIERALVYASWEERRGEAGQAFREAATAARELGSPVEEQRVLAEARDFAATVGDLELERWALDRQVEIDPATLSAWSRLIALSEDDSTLEEMIETLPDDENAHALYASVLSQRGRSEEAVAHLLEMEGRLADPVPLQRALAALHVEAGRLEEARQIEQALRAKHPDRAETDDVIGLLAMREGRFAEAAEATRRRIEREETPFAQLRLAEAEFRLGQLAPALVAVNRVLELDGEQGAQSLAALRLKGRIELANGDGEAAARTFRRIRRLGGGSLPREDVGPVARALYATGRADAGREVLGAALALPDPPLEAILIFLRHESGRDPETARRVLETAREQHPYHPALVNHQIRFALRDGEPERAEQIAAEAVAAHPTAPLLRLQAQLLAANGKHEEALAPAERAFERNPELPGIGELVVQLLGQLGRTREAVARLEARPQLSVSNRVLLARLHILAGANEKALPLLEAAVAEQPDLYGAKNDLAFLLARAGKDLERALRLAQEARTGMPRSPQVADTLGYVYLQRSLPEAALDQFQAAIDLAEPQSADWATSQYHRGLALKALGRPEEARAAFELALASSVPFPEADEARREIDQLAGVPSGAS